MFQSIGRRGNYANAGRVAADDLVRSFAAARRNSTDFGAIARGAAAIVSNEKVQATKRSEEVLKSGIAAASRVNTEKQRIAINETTSKSKRKAGALAAAGQLFGNAGQFMGEKRTKREVGTQDSYYDSRIASNREKAGELRAQAGEVDLTGGFTPMEVPEFSTTTNTGSNTGGATGTTVSSAQAVNSGKGKSSKGGKFSQTQMTDFAIQAGFSPEQARIMGAIGMGESGGDSGIDTVMSGLDPGKSNEYSIGLFQINAQAHGDKLAKLGYTVDDLRDPLKNAKVAKLVHDEVGGFTPWSVYSKGIYKDYL